MLQTGWRFRMVTWSPLFPTRRSMVGTCCVFWPHWRSRVGGTYRFNGEMVNLKDYRQCLAVKRQIGYVAADAAMISNRTIRENLLLTRFYYENDLTIDIDQKTEALCKGCRSVPET
jgi:hypothetical protein